MFARYFLFLLLSFGFVSMTASEVPASVIPMLEELDHMLEIKDDFKKHKEERLNLLRLTMSNTFTPEERYWLNSKLYEEFLVYNSDSALHCAEENLRYCLERNDKRNASLWTIRKTFVLVATGLMHDAEMELRKVNVEALDTAGRVEYYEQQLHLASHILLYNANLNPEHFRSLVPIYKDSIRQYCPPTHPLYLWYKANRRQPGDDNSEIKRELTEVLERSDCSSRIDAMNAYALYSIYREEDNMEQLLKWLIVSSKADLRTVNKEIASLEELAKYLFKLGDLDRAYAYMSYCSEVALEYNNRVRLYSVAKIEQSIFDKLLDELNAHNRRRQIYLVVVSLMALLLLGMSFFTARANRRLHKTQGKMREANSLLRNRQLELTEANNKLAELNEQLKDLNEQLNCSVLQLDESNFLKEEYIGAVFLLCSSYINKMEDFRRSLNRKLKTNLYDEARAQTESPAAVQGVVKEFYQSFDAIFLNIYPSFVEDFNELLRPEERVCLKEGELLTTELRIYALVRMGISDSLRISQVLHCSPQTVYNNRNKTRNKALDDRENFDEAVRNLGKNA